MTLGRFWQNLCLIPCSVFDLWRYLLTSYCSVWLILPLSCLLSIFTWFLENVYHSSSYSTLPQEYFGKMNFWCQVLFLPSGVYSGWGIVVTILARPSVHTYVHLNFFFEILGFWGLSHQKFLMIFSFFEKEILGACHAIFFGHFSDIRAYSGCTASQLIYAGKFLFADFESK